MAMMELVESVLRMVIDRPVLAGLGAASIVGALYLVHISEILRQIGRWTRIGALVIAVVGLLTMAGAMTGVVSIGELRELLEMVGVAVVTEVHP